MTATELQDYLYEHIPLSKAMEVTVRDVRPCVVLDAPLAPNINHRGTGFGGSIATLATLAAWSVVRLIIPEGVRLVIAREEVDFVAPVTGDFSAIAEVSPEDAERFLMSLSRRGKARLTVEATVRGDGVACAQFRGQFVALSHAP